MTADQIHDTIPDAELSKLVLPERMKAIRARAKQICEGHQHGHRYEHMLRAAVAMGVALELEYQEAQKRVTGSLPTKTWKNGKWQ